MMIATERLDAGIRAMLMAHFQRMPADDLRLRFGRPLTPDVLSAYVDGIDFVRDAVFGVRDERRELVGVAHVAFDKDLAELGLSVLPGFRKRGVGSALFERAARHARNRRVREFIMRCLMGNVPIMRIAQRYGMRVVAEAGEAAARLDLPGPTIASRVAELLAQARARRELRRPAPCS
jgi:GNAT superfamily N-acetyltransferase